MSWARLYVALAGAVSRLTVPPAPEKKEHRMNYHALTGLNAVDGCTGIDSCIVCVTSLEKFVPELECGFIVPLPFYDLIKWEDGTYSLLPSPNPSMN